MYGLIIPMERLTNNSDLLSRLHELGSKACRPASLPTPGRLASLHPELDRFLVGGLPFGTIVEIGSPLGRGGRRPLIDFIAAATQGRSTPLPCWVLWAYSSGQVYPPAWRAHGVNLSRVCFARSGKPLAQLRPALLSPLFKVIVLDAPTHLSGDDLTFLAHHARLQGKLFIIIRNYMLQRDGHSIWPKLRLNSWRQPDQPGSYRLDVVRGLSPRTAVIRMDDI
jgi:hypothetical protein